MKHKQWIRPVLFTLVGVLAGFIYYCFIGCDSGSCAITSNPVSSMVHMGLIGYLLSAIFEKEHHPCNM